MTSYGLSVRLLGLLPLLVASSAMGQSAIPADALLPDIVEEPPRHLNVQRAQQEEWLRFTSTHWNGGFGPLQIRGSDVRPCTIEENGVQLTTDCTYATQEVFNSSGQLVYTQPAGTAIFHVDHNHWHQDNVANFVLRSGSLTGPIVGQATKITYCLIDYDHSANLSNNSGKTYFECGADLQGISVGYGDEYHHSTHGQEIEITTVPAGTYYLTHDADPVNKWAETRDDNNFSWVKFTLTRDASSNQAKIEIVEESACTGLASNPLFADIACGNTSNK